MNLADTTFLVGQRVGIVVPGHCGLRQGSVLSASALRVLVQFDDGMRSQRSADELMPLSTYTREATQ